MTTINIYLSFNGNCQEAFDLYRSVFGGEYAVLSRFGDMPPGSEPPVPEEEKNRIMHVSLPISAETVLMGSDTGGGYAKEFQPGNNFSISINTDSREMADRYFEKLGKGGEIKMPLAQTFWGEYFGQLTDRFGINWMVSYRPEVKMQ